MGVAIVGGGIGGLTAALLLSRQGASVDVYEQADRLGGRLAFQEGSGYRIDRGPTIVLLPEMLLEILEEAGIGRERIPLIRCDPLYRIHYADGTVLHKWQDAQRQVQELDRVFPGESEAFGRYMSEMEHAFSAGKRAFLDKAFLRKRDFYTRDNLLLLARLRVFRSVRAIAARYFRDEKLIDAFSLQTLYIGGEPLSSPGLYTLLPYAEHAFGIWYVKGGYASLVPLLEQVLEQRGVRLFKRTAVERLQVEHGNCTGLVAEGELRAYDAVVYNGDFPGIAGLLPQEDAAPASPAGLKPVGSKAPARLRRRFKPSSGCVLVYLGLDRQWPEAQAHQFFLPKSLTRGLNQIFKENRLPDDPSFYVFYPGAIDDTAAPAGESVMYLLVPCPSVGHVDWDKQLPGLVDRVIAEAERRGFPGLRASIRWQSVRSPRDAEAEGLYEGGSFGIAPTLRQSALFRPQFVPFKINRLYAVGASVHPGGGIPIVMQGARLLARHLSKEMMEWNSNNV